MAVHIGINPLTWTNDDMPELGGDTPLEVCLAEAKEAGYAGIELGHKFPRQPGRLRPLLAGHGLRLISGWYGSRLLERSAEEEVDAMAEHLDLLSAMGCEAMVFAEVSGCIHGNNDKPLSQRPQLKAGDWAGLGQAMTEVAEHMLRRGVRLAFHHHMGTVVESEDDIGQLMAATGDAVGLLLDTGHLAFAGGDIVNVVRRHGRRIAHVHCKDVRPAPLQAAQASDKSFLAAVLDGVFTVPGDGAIDFRAVLGELRRAGYSGWLVVEAEQDPARADPLTYARLGFKNLSKFVAATGL